MTRSWPLELTHDGDGVVRWKTVMDARVRPEHYRPGMIFPDDPANVPPVYCKPPSRLPLLKLKDPAND